MVRSWFHQVDEEWLRSRSHYLTATEIVKLLPEYRRWKKKPCDFPEQFVGLWGEKKAIQLGAEIDPSSVGPAARGHIMEPYAIDEYNANMLGPVPLVHVDDVLFWSEASKGWAIGYSPDAMDQTAWNSRVRSFNRPDQPASDANVEVIGEVKSYDAGHHIRSCVIPDKIAPERYQLAVAFAVWDGMEQGELIFYNPSAPIHMDVKSYRRADLAEEIEDVLGVYDLWVEVAERLENVKDMAPSPTWEESVIWEANRPDQFGIG